jgi:O-antigen/teichoic acid export membrane protein
MDRINNLVKIASKSDYFRNVATLFTGTTLAQIIPIVVTPILTRIYTPIDYGVLAIFVAFSSLCTIIATLRYEAAILLPNEDVNAMSLTILSGLCVFFAAIVVSLILCIFNKQILITLKNPNISIWLLFLIPLYVVFIGFSNALNNLLNRHKQYKKLAFNRVSVALLTASASLAFGFAGFGSTGLILAIVIGQCFALCLLSIWTWNDLREGLKKFSFSNLKEVAITYRKFPLFSLPSDAANSMSQQLPIFLLTKFFGSNVVGHFSFSQKILGMPLNLISQSISDVFKQRASADYNKFGNCNQIFIKTSKLLSAMSIVPLIAICIFAPIIFRVIFGEAWEQAGQYTRYLAPLYIFRFIVSPLSYIFYIANRQDADLIGQIGLLFVSIGSMFFGFYLKNPDIAIVTFSCGYVLIYIFYFLGARNLSRGKSFALFSRMS